MDRATKTEGIVQAATKVFLRYGFARTTIGDIASEAGVSRPALYQIFTSKEDVFDAVIRRMDADWHADLATTLGARSSIEAKLRHVCEQWTTHGTEVVQAYPDAKDLFALEVPAVRAMYEHFEALLAGLIQPAVKASGLGATSVELARSLVFALRGIKDCATSVADMRRLADVQVMQLVAALGLTRRRAR